MRVTTSVPRGEGKPERCPVRGCGHVEVLLPFTLVIGEHTVISTKLCQICAASIGTNVIDRIF